MSKIRVLQVVTIMNRGGLETMLMNYYRKINREEIQFDFLVHRMEKGDYDEEIERLGGKIYKMPSIRPGNYKKYFKKLDEFFKEHKEYKIVHSHINENSSFVLRAAKKFNVPCRIAHNHVAGLGIDYKFPFRMYARMYLKNNVNKYFACSEEAAKWLFGKDILKKEKVEILNNAIDIDKFKYSMEKREKVINSLNLKGKLVIGHVGRFSPSKNHNFLIDVFNELKKREPDAELLLIGKGNEEKNINERVKSLNLESSVKFLGLRSDIDELMSAMDVFLFPSHFEALPVVLVEAQSIGLKSIISTGIPKEVNISETIEFISLEKSLNEWVDLILSIDKNKSNNREKIVQAGYDIDEKVKWLSNYYIENYKANIGGKNEVSNNIYSNI